MRYRVKFFTGHILCVTQLINSYVEALEVGFNIIGPEHDKWWIEEEYLPMEWRRKYPEAE